jgi:cathepsin L
LNDGPVGALIVADSGFMSYSGGVYSCGQNKTMDQLNHAVLIIGMDNNSNYIIKNSYGSNWGDHGFGMINSSYNDCGIRIAVYQLTYGSIVEIFWIMSILIVVMLF